MSWALYDDELTINKKILRLRAIGVDGLAALGLHLLCNTWSRNQGAAGRVPDYVVAAMSEEGLRLAKILEAVDMFEPYDGVDQGWMIHDYDQYGGTDEQTVERRKQLSSKRSEAGKRGAQAKASKRAEGDSKASANDQQTSSPTPMPLPSSLKTSTTTSPSYPREVVVVLNAILEAELADENPSSIRRPDAWRAKVRPRIEAEWGPIVTDAIAAIPADCDTTLYDLASQVLDEHEHKLHYQILSRIADLEITCTPPKPNESALDSKPSGPADDGPSRPSASGAAGSSATSSTPQNEPLSASVTDIASSRRSRSGGRPTEPSPAASSTPKPAQNGKDRPTVDEQSSPTSEPTSAAEHDLSVAASLGARLAKAGKPRHEVLELMSGFPDAEVAAAVDAWVAAMPERRRYENVVYQVDHVRPEDGQVFTVKVHQGGHVTGFRADFPADVWRSAELVEA